jgi:3-oxoacyl-[acyl-carrier-protein] synthase-1
MALGHAALASPLSLAHAGACTSLGATAQETSFLYRVGAAGMREGAVLDATQQAATLCTVPTLDPFLVGPARLYALLELALNDFKREAGDAYSALRVKLLVLLAESFSQRLPNGGNRADLVAGDMRDRTRAALGVTTTLATLTGDVAGFGQALPTLASELAQGAFDVALVVAAHSDYEPERLVSLSERGRLFSPDNLDGLIPGEGAAVLALATPSAARRFQLPLTAQILSAAAAFEKATPDNDESAFEAAGMTVAVRRAYEAAPLRGRRIGWLMSDLNLEMFRAYEFQAVMARTQKLFGPPQVYDMPAHRLGHLGATTMPMHLILAARAWRHGFAPDAFMLSMAGSDNGARTSFVASA